MDWRDEIKLGDVLRAKSGDLRIVRGVSRWNKNGLINTVTFTIRNCSWTGRCYTVLNRSDLKTRCFEPTGVSCALDGEIDARLLEEIKQTGKPLIDCCDVKGIP